MQHDQYKLAVEVRQNIWDGGQYEANRSAVTAEADEQRRRTVSLMNAIEVNNLTKSFGNVRALRSVSFSVDEGEVFGLIGPDGAGKTTAMRMLCGLSIPTSGKGLVAGCDIRTQSEEDEVLRSGKADAVVVFDADYDRKLSQISSGLPCPPAIQLVMDASNVNMVGAATAYLQSVLLGSSSSQNIFETRMLFNPQMKSAYNFVPGIMGMIFILVCAIMTSVSIVRERETGTMEVLLVSPARPIQIVIAKMIPYFGISCVVLFTILVLAKYLLGLPMSGGVGGVIAISLLYLELSLAIGLLVSNVAKTRIMALLMSAMVMMIPTMMLSGMLFPIENLPKFFRLLSCVVPTRYYIDAVRKMMIQGVSIAAVWQDCLILLGMTAAVLGVSLRKFNDRLE